MYEEPVNQKSKDGIIEIISEGKEVHEQQRNSIFMAEYQRFLNTADSSNIDPEQIKGKLRSGNIYYDQDKFHDQMIIEIEEYSANFEAVKLNVQYGHFEVTVNIINVDSVSPFHSLEIIDSGGFGGIYKYVDGDEVTAIKSIKIEEEKFDFAFQQVIKEYILFKIAAVLNVAPKANTIFGFDIVVFSDCLNFSMEQCEIGAVKFQETIDLDKKLALLHHLHIVHLDIKPQNIGFSSRNGYIFIDFGLSRMVRQKVGEQTLSSFAGSINFCSKQMLDLFSKNCVEYVDLYYNDAFCLIESLKVLNAQPNVGANIRSMSEYLHTIGSNLSWLSAYRLLLETKFFLFQLSSGRLSETNFFSRNSDFVKQQRTQIIKFVSFLPQSLELIQFLKRYLKCQGESKKMNLSNEIIVLRKTNQQSLSEAFMVRFKIIQNLKFQGQRPRSTSKCLQVNKFFNVKNIKIYSAGLYKLALVQFIKINSFNKNFNEKLLACSLCFQTYITSEQAVTGTKLYKRVMQFIFETSLNAHEPENPQILINAIETVIILELFDERYIINAFKLILNLQLTFTQKMRIQLQFITSIQLLIYKFVSIYSHKILATHFTNILKTYLAQNSKTIIDKNQRSICTKIQELILFKESTINNPHQKIELVTSLNNHCNYLPFQLKNLNQKLENMIFSEETIAQLLLQNTCNPKDIKLLITLLNKQNHYSQTFNCLHLLLYRINKQILHMKINKNIYHLFHQEMKYFEEHKHFDIYIFNSIAVIRQSSPNKLALQRRQIYEQNYIQANKSTLSYGQFFQSLNIAMKNDRKKYLYIGQLMIGYSGIYFNRQCVEFLNPLLNSLKITTIHSTNHHEQAVIPHYRTLSYEIVVVTHIIEFLSRTNMESERWDQCIVHYMRYFESCISRISCFECKVYGLLQVKSLYRGYLSAKNEWQQSFLSALDLMVFYMKYKQFSKSIYNIIIPLIRTWFIKRELIDKYNPIAFIYSISNNFDFHHYMLVDIKEFNIFMIIYLYIAQKLSESQMVVFLLKITQKLRVSNSVDQFKTFYYSILHLVKTSQQKYAQDFHHYHTNIIQQLLQYQLLKSNPYIALYFSALLEMQRGCCYSMQMLRLISKYCEKLILNRYYHRFSQECESVRKRRYLLSIHFKRSLNQIKLSSILKVKLKDKAKKVKCYHYEMFKHFITIFYRNSKAQKY